MSNLGLSSLSSIQLVGQFGNHLAPLVWLTITAVLMYVGPAAVAVIYLLMYDQPWRTQESTKTPSDIREEEAEERKAA